MGSVVKGRCSEYSKNNKIINGIKIAHDEETHWKPTTCRKAQAVSLWGGPSQEKKVKVRAGDKGGHGKRGITIVFRPNDVSGSGKSPP